MNNKLVEAMGRHVNGGAGRETYVAFLAELAASTLLAPIRQQPVGSVRPDRSKSVEGPVTLDVIGQRAADGRTLISVFTDDESFARLMPAAPALAELPCAHVFDLASQMGVDQVVVNTGSPTAVAVDRQFFAALSEGKAPVVA